MMCVVLCVIASDGNGNLVPSVVGEGAVQL